MESVIHYLPALSTPGDACDDCNVDDGRADDAHDDDDGDYDGLASDAVTLPAAGMHPWLTRSRWPLPKMKSAGARCDDDVGDAGVDAVAAAAALLSPGNRSRCAAPTCYQLRVSLM